jgi:hypothetical protein
LPPSASAWNPDRRNRSSVKARPKPHNVSIAETRREGIGANQCRSRVEQHFSIETMVAGYEGVYRQILK